MPFRLARPKPIRLVLAGLTVCGLFEPPVLARDPIDSIRVQSELGYETFARFPEDPTPSNPSAELSMSRPYIIQKIDVPMPQGDLNHSLPLDALRPDKFEAEYRAWANFSYLQSNSGTKASVDLRTLKLEWVGESWNLTLGLQDIVWGETFGDRGVDVVNPRDYSDYLLTDLRWAILPVWSANLLKLFDPFSVQIIYTPLTVRDLLPVEVGGVPVVNGTSQPLAFRESEYGGRLGWLLPEGTDLKFYYYHHYDRIPVVEALTAGSAQVGFEVVQPEMIDTYGASLSHALDAFVLRADVAYQVNELLTAVDYGTPVQGSPIHAIIGTDWTGADQTTIGVQGIYDSDPRDGTPLFWGTAQARLRLLRGNLIPELLIYKGVNNADFWAEPGVTAQLSRNWQLHAQGDYMLGRQGSLFQLYQEENRLVGRLSYLF